MLLTTAPISIPPPTTPTDPRTHSRKPLPYSITKTILNTATMPEEKSFSERWNDYLASKYDSPSYRRSPSRGRTTYYSSYSSTTRAYSPPRTSTYTSRAYSPPRTSTYTSYTSRAYSPPHTSSYSRAYSPPRTSSYSRAYSPPRTSYTSRAYSPPRTSTYTSRAYSPPRTTSYSRTDSPIRTSRARSPSRTRTYTRSRSRSRGRSRSRLSSIRKSLSSALSSVPKETLHDFGDAVGTYVADRLGWSELDGRTTAQREGKDPWSGRGSYYGYSSMA
jgi:hypothetical protein